MQLNAILFSVSWFYSQLQTDAVSYLVSSERLLHYQRILSANLDGLLCSPWKVVKVAATELHRWKGDGELFAAAYLALARPVAMGEELFSMVMDFVQKQPQPHFMEAIAHVFPWLEKDRAHELLPEWLVSDDPLRQRIALAALGLRREPYPGDLSLLFAHEDEAMRAEACRYAGRLRRFDSIPALRQSLSDDNADVREQAAIALLVCNEPASAVPVLLAATMRYAAAVDHGGIASIRAERRAQHLARLLGHAIPYPCADSAAQTLLAELPPYLTILTLAHHGNPALIPQLLPFLRDKNPGGADGLYKRRALWALSFILGINPEHEDLLADNPSLSADWPIAPGLDQDTGLPEGDADKVERWWDAHCAHYLTPAVLPSSSALPSSPLLSGQRMDTPDAARELMASGMQAQRFAAALHACRLSPKAPWLDTRAPWAMQKRWIETPWN